MSNVYVFSEDTLIKALEDWKTREIMEHPDHQQTIETTVIAMTEFLNSNEAKRYKMILSVNQKE